MADEKAKTKAPAGKKAAAKPRSAAKTAPKAASEAAPAPKREPKPRKSPKREPGQAPGVVRGTRKMREGIVVSNKMEKTVVVTIERRIQHPLYGKVVVRTERFKAHDILGCDVGDRVQILETRPLSKEKRWRVSRIIEKVK